MRRLSVDLLDWIGVLRKNPEVRGSPFRAITISFPSDGKWDAVSFSDVPGNRIQFDTGTSSFVKGRSVTARMEPGGGFAMFLMRWTLEIGPVAKL